MPQIYLPPNLMPPNLTVNLVFLGWGMENPVFSENTIWSASPKLGIPVIGGRWRYGGGRRKFNGRRQRHSQTRSLSSLHPIPRHTDKRVKKLSPPSILVLFNIRFINNKTFTLQTFIAAQLKDLACVTKTWTREGKSVTLNDLTSIGYLSFNNHQLRGREGAILV